MKLDRNPLVAGIFAAMLLGGAMLSAPAEAADPIKLWDWLDEDDNTVVQYWYDPDTKTHFGVIISADGNTYTTVALPGNPNPEDTTTGKGSHTDRPDIVALIRSGDMTYRVRIVPADSPQLQGFLPGGGLGPRYNPSDDDNGTGPAGAATGGSMDVKKTPAEIRQEIAVANEVARSYALIGAAMGDGDEGGSESPTGANKNGNGTGPGDDEGNYTEGQNKTVGQTEKDLLGPKPEFVNPPHLDRTSTGDGSHAATGGGGNSGGGAHNGLGAKG